MGYCVVLEGAKIVERFPTYYATLLDSLNHLGDQLQQLVGRMSPEMSDKIEQLTDLITSNLGQIAPEVWEALR